MPQLFEHTLGAKQELLSRQAAETEAAICLCFLVNINLQVEHDVREATWMVCEVVCACEKADKTGNVQTATKSRTAEKKKNYTVA